MVVWACFFKSPVHSICITLAFSFTAPCEGDTFFCHSNMCINHTLVCNGIQNCVYPWDENHCKGTLMLNLETHCLMYLQHTPEGEP